MKKPWNSSNYNRINSGMPKRKQKRPEDLVRDRVVNFLKMKYPTTVYRIDLAADIKLTIGQAVKNKALNGKWSEGYPDLFIAQTTKKYGGLYIELKAPTKTGKVPNTAHTRKQAVMHEILRKAGYMVEFAVGYEQAVALIDKYMNLKRKNNGKKKKS